MKRILSLLLCLLLVFPTAALAEEPEEPALDDCVREQAISLAMACWLSGWETGDDIRDPLLLWDAAGWYAALLYRAEGSDLVSPGRIAAFLESLGWRGVFSVPDTWEEYGVLRRLASTDGSQSLDFVQHKREIDAMLGVNTEVFVTALDEDTVEAALTYHMNGEEATQWVYEFDFVSAEEGAEFPYCLLDARFRDEGPEIDPELGFTWEQLLEANRLQNVLERYKAVQIREEGADTPPVTWLFKRGGNLAIVTDAQGYTWGQYRGCYFEVREDDEGEKRPVISEFDSAAADWESRDGFLTDYLSGVCVMKLDRTEGERIWTECTFRSGFTETIAFDRGTLILREIDYDYEGAETPGVTGFHYSQPAPAFSFLNSWDEPLRMLTLVWEDFDNGQSHVRTEFARVPGDWEYLPYGARWDEYAVYLNKGYTQPYEYPGDGVAYTLYLTTAKG